MNLLLDLGNTRAKWAWLRPEGLQRASAVAWDSPNWGETLVAAWATAPAPDAVWVAAVAAPARVDALRARIESLWPGVPVQLVASPREGAGVINAYAVPERLGVDRFLAMAAARVRQAGPVVVAGCGTALAIDVLEAGGRHRGGVIAPSPARMREAVLASTARVIVEQAAPVRALGDSTEQGLESGCWLAAAALVDRVADDAAAAAAGASHAVVLHGGDAARIAPLLRHAATIAHDLVLEGLVRWIDGARRGPGGLPGA
jgi:type III pantothenate kinase